ncbi:MAG: SGNH/GDSL hydrolase family protein [Planctomycetes bacterium]|nr:SGNH/GDSL hydrolase family protein [Planctomycetota bacterium]
MKHFIVFLALLVFHSGTVRAGEKRVRKELADTDRVLLLGGGFIEQERLHCYLETRLLRHHPRGQLLFRNLGWGGDTVRGSARTGGFENPQGFARLLKEVTQWKPTVILVGYGMNESFAGAKGIDVFVKDYRSLLDKLAPLKSRLILLAPTYHEALGPPHPDPTEHNKSLQSYAEAIRDLAQKRDVEFINLFHAMKTAKATMPGRIFTTNGIQPNELGYAVIARTVEKALGYASASDWHFTVSAKGKVREQGGVKEKVEATKRGLRLWIQEPVVPVTDPLAKEGLVLRVTDLADGMHVLTVGGKEVLRATGEAWGRGLFIAAGNPDGEKLRQAVIAKNELFYRRWRPFNDHSRHFDFLRGDFSLYDKAIADRERAIQDMLAPRWHCFEIVPLGKSK